MKRRVIVACDDAIVTSIMAVEEIKRPCETNNIQLDLVRHRIIGIETYTDGADFIRTTARVDRTLDDILVVHGMSSVSNVDTEALQQKILTILMG